MGVRLRYCRLWKGYESFPTMYTEGSKNVPLCYVCPLEGVRFSLRSL
jgi:hypothetical protein